MPSTRSSAFTLSRSRSILSVLSLILLCAGCLWAQDQKSKGSGSASTGSSPELSVDGEPECDNAIGIDLGTTFSCVAVYRNGKVDIIQNELGHPTTPSQVCFSGNKDYNVGVVCDEMKVSSPGSVIYDAKRLIGRDFEDSDVKSALSSGRWPFKVIKNVKEKGKLYIEVKSAGSPDKKEPPSTFLLTPEEVSAKVLSRMKKIAEDYLGEKVCSAVITVPAYFNDAQRNITKDAATAAGLKVARIINEPTSAAIAYGLNKANTGRNPRILVYDLGGGTFDVSVLELNDGLFEVKSTGGDTNLGGQDFNQNLLNKILQIWHKKKGLNIGTTRPKISMESMARLNGEVERVKRDLSAATSTRLKIANFHDKMDIDEVITRAMFVDANSELFNSTFELVDKVLAEGHFAVTDIDDVVLVGGSTRIPEIVKKVKEKFKMPPKKDINPDEAVAYGAAVQAALLSGKKDSGIDQILLLDVTSLTLGIEVQGGLISAIVPRNSPIPIVKSQKFTTVADNQSTVSIKVYEGERALAKDNFELGRFELTGILPAARGTPQIEVSFKINADGILEVSAADKATGNTNTKVIRNDNRRLSPERIEALIKESEEHAEKDRLAKETAEARNQFEMFMYGMKSVKSTAEKNKKIDAKEIEELSKVLSDLEKWYEDNTETATIEQFKEKMESAAEITAKISKELYSGGEGPDMGAGDISFPPPGSGDDAASGPIGGEDLSGSDI